MKQTIQPVILCGGSGSRLWPISRPQNPKQFVPLLNDRSLIQETVARLSVITGILSPLFMCHQQHEGLLRSHLGGLDIHHPTIIFEPEQKNTGPCIAMAAKWTQEHHPEAIMAIFPGDHYFEDDQEFAKAIELAAQAAQLGGIVCLGVVPDYPATGFGYIKKGEIKIQSIKVASFVEKPNAQVAKEFVDSGDYLWNSGIFIASAKQILVEIARHSPVIKRYALKALEQARVSDQAYYVAPQQYSQCPSVPFDIAVMEQTDRAHVIPYMGVWNDLGTWESILAHSILDQDSNSIKGNVYHNKCENSLLWGHTRPLVVLGIENVVVIDTPVAILVSGGECIQEVKAMVEKVSVSRPIQVGKVASSDRPWGSFEVLEVAEGYKVKRLTVKPGGKLSLQRHRLRSESWTVIAGQAWVTCDSTFKKLEVGESTYIAQGSIHRLENKASLPLVVMEVQFGSYLEEDDIERLEDIYDRKCS